MMILLIVSSVAALAYLCLSVKVCGGIPVSLSDTYYKLGGNGWLFQTAMVLIAVTLAPVWLSLSASCYQWMVWFACSSLLFVASSPCFREKWQGLIHYSSAVIGGVSAVLWQVCEGLWDVALWFALIGGALSLRWRKQWCFWLECSVVASLLYSFWGMTCERP